MLIYPEYITIFMYSNASWIGKIEPFVKLLLTQERFRPDIIGNVDDRKGIPLSIERIPYLEKNFLDGRSIEFGKYTPEYSLCIQRRLLYKRNRMPDQLYMGTELSLFEPIEQKERFLDFSKSLFAWGDMMYGYIGHQRDFHDQTMLPKGITHEDRFIRAVGTDVRFALPGIFWANFFNVEYVRWFGVEKFDTLPCYRMEELPDGGRLVLTSRSPLDYDESGETQEALKKHLGRDAFGDIYNPTKSTRSPIHDGSIKLPNEYNEWLKHFKRSKK